MNAKLTREDWAEIYYALETKRKLLADGHYGPEDRPGQDAEWAAHLSNIIEKIGPDGSNMA